MREAPLSSPWMRFLGIDFGEKRIGVAECDETGSIVVPAGTVERKSDASAIAEICRMARDRDIEKLVVGLPRKDDGSEGKTAQRARSFARKLAETSGLPVVLHDESGTTVEARGRLRESLASSLAGIDAMAAVVLLEDFLSQAPPD